jgi:hypothetical protein
MRQINRQLTIAEPLWQRNYHDRVVRNEADLSAIRQYIGGNPAKWDGDENNPGYNAASTSFSNPVGLSIGE